MAQPQGALLVGSINLPDAESTFRAAADILGDRLKRIPDGEVGDRFHWIIFQADILGSVDGLERVGDEPVYIRHLDSRPLRVADGVDPATLELPPLGYAAAALDSWGLFRSLRDAGEIPATTRFQVSLPTPAAVVGAFFGPADQAAIEPVYAAALYRELDTILAGIPHDSLAIQWDTAVEFGFIEFAGYGTAFEAWFGDVWKGVIERAAEQAGRVPLGVELGFHFCYGDAGEQHFFEPTDTANLVTFARLLFAITPRHIDWIHLPVPIGRDDDAYFVPLEELAVPAGTEVYLGLVHREDGPEGARRRAEAASRHFARFGVATECGCGRAPEDATIPLLETHRDVAAAW